MTVPVLVQAVDGRFQASVAGSPGLRAEGATRQEALDALQADLDAQFRQSELVWLKVPRLAPSDLAGTYTGEDAEAIREMCAELYRERDEEKRREFPE